MSLDNFDYRLREYMNTRHPDWKVEDFLKKAGEEIGELWEALAHGDMDRFRNENGDVVLCLLMAWQRAQEEAESIEYLDQIDTDRADRHIACFLSSRELMEERLETQRERLRTGVKVPEPLRQARPRLLSRAQHMNDPRPGVFRKRDSGAWYSVQQVGGTLLIAETAMSAQQPDQPLPIFIGAIEVLTPERWAELVTDPEEKWSR